MEDKLVNAGIFWVTPNGCLRQSVIELHKGYYESQADGNGFVNYPYSHYEMWDEAGFNKGDDCYKYPRGRVIYDANKKIYKIFADECIAQSTIDEVAELFAIDNYELCRDEHYVCSFCNNRKNKSPCLLDYKILRGKDKIGENLIEVTYGDTQILVELGKSLNGDDGQIEQEVLNKHYSAVVVSHYHEDHAGLIQCKHDCPVFIGSGAYRILQAMREYNGEEMSSNIKTYRNGRSFYVGGVQITPYLCDHSAYDSYMLLFEAGGKSILYTGDFRFHGRKDSSKLLPALPKSVDVLIHEGTNIGKNACVITETELEHKATEIMQSTNGPVFVLQSGTNIDRLVSVYRASKRSARLLYMDNYASLVALSAGGKIPRPDVFPKVIAFTPLPVRGKRKDMFFEIKNKRGLKSIANGTSSFTMLVRPTMLAYLKKLIATANYSEASLIYSVWKGYKETEYMSEFLSEMRALNVNIIDLHTSGHASAEDIELLLQSVKAKQTVCIHTER